MSGPFMYSSVARFEAAVSAGAIVGYAAPAAGSLPTKIELVSDSIVIASVAATRFSEMAAVAGARHGWCGFEIEGVGEAFAIGGAVALRCAVSKEVLARPSLQQLVDGSDQRSARISVEALLKRVRRHDCATTGDQILPFAEAFRLRVGREEFLERTMSMLLRRFVPFSEAVSLANLRGNEEPATVLRRATTMRAFVADPFAYIPGPFHPEFRYGRHAFA